MKRLPPLALALAAALAVVATPASHTHAADNAVAEAENATAGNDNVIAPIPQRFSKDGVEEVPEFRPHVAPLLGKLGCNGRACHGSFQGQGGFRLSLFGYDFKMDHEGLTEGDEPRVDPELPENSLALLKPTLEMPHRGGKRMDVGSWEYRVIRRWIEAGAKSVPDTQPEFVRLDVTPSEILFSGKDETTQLKVVAVWDDGTREDVTPLCRYDSNSDQVAEVAKQGLVTAVDPGDTHVVISYDKGVVPIPVIRPVTDLVGSNYPDVSTPTEIDRLVVQKLKKLGLVPSDLSTDAEFLRRVSLDLAGTLPSPDEVRNFLADESPDKRTKKIDELLESPGYAAWWTTKLCDYTGNNGGALNNVSPVRGMPEKEWYAWIYKRVKENAPYDELISGIVTATSRRPGQSYTEYAKEMSKLYHDEDLDGLAARPSMPYYWSRRNLRTSEERAIGFAYTFLGIRIQCAQCHKHPFDQWTQDDFKQFTGFFGGIQAGRGANRDSKEEYDKILAALEIGGNKKGNQLRRELPKHLKEGKTVPFNETYVTPARASRNNPNNKQLKEARKQIAALEKQIAVLKKDDDPNKGKLKNLEGQLTRQKSRFARLQKGNSNRRRGTTAPTAKLLGDDVVNLTEHADPRQPLMEWLRADDNDYFARAFVNRVWAGYFNIGIVNPPDNLSKANPPSNKPLLDYLTRSFIEHDFDMKWLHREIANSRTYQLSWRPNDTNAKDETNFSRQVPRRLPAEVAVDAINQATASNEKIADYKTDMTGRSIAVAASGYRNRGSDAYALTIFGRSVRENNCDCDRSSEASLLQTVFLQNDREVLNLLERRDGWLNQVERKVNPKAAKEANNKRPGDFGKTVANFERRIKRFEKEKNTKQAQRIKQQLAQYKKRFAAPKKAEPAKTASQPIENLPELINQAYLRTLSRFPEESEMEQAREYVNEADDKVAGLKDVLWALLNTKEFIVNH